MNFKKAKVNTTITRYRVMHAIRNGIYKGLMATPLKGTVTKTLNSQWRQNLGRTRIQKQWHRYGPQSPMAGSDKQRTIIEFARRFDLAILVETGTFMGDVVEATKSVFQKIYSIELDKKLYEKAKQRFTKDLNITILHGDSADILPTILADLRTPALFWLDGHFSGGETALGNLQTPVLSELKHILQHPVVGHVILIDDARCFVGVGDYPFLDELRTYIDVLKPGMTFEVSGDIIRIFSSPGF